MHLSMRMNSVKMRCGISWMPKLGLNRDFSVEEIKQKVKDKTITDILNKVYVKPGDVLFVPAGTIHAIGKGLFICEIQQNSNSTYEYTITT